MNGYSGLYDGVFGESYALIVNRPSLLRKAAKVMRRRAMTHFREVIDVVAAGSSINGGAAVTYKRVKNAANPGSGPANGGAQELETVTKISTSSTTTSADAAQVDDVVNWRVFPNTNGVPNYPNDLSGNGGGNAQSKAYAVGA